MSDEVRLIQGPAPGSPKRAEFESQNIAEQQLLDDAVSGRVIQFGAVTADVLGAGALTVDTFIESSGYVPGVSGWRIHGDGSVEFESGLFRGDILGATIALVDTTNDDVFHPASNPSWQAAPAGALPPGWSDLWGTNGFRNHLQDSFFQAARLNVTSAAAGGEVWATGYDAMPSRRNVDVVMGLYTFNGPAGVAARVSGGSPTSLGTGYYFRLAPNADPDFYDVSIVRAVAGTPTTVAEGRILTPEPTEEPFVIMDISIREGQLRFAMPGEINVTPGQFGTELVLRYTDPDPLPPGAVALFAEGVAGVTPVVAFVDNYDIVGPERGQTRANQFGDLWVGAETAADAPFLLDRAGRVTMRGYAGSPATGFVETEGRLSSTELELVGSGQTVRVSSDEGFTATEVATLVGPQVVLNGTVDGVNIVTAAGVNIVTVGGLNIVGPVSYAGQPGLAVLG